MSDISDSGSFNLGLANIASNNYGPTATANQANTNASTALTQQQAQGAAISNAQQALVLRGKQIGLQMLYQMPGVIAAGDQSGVTSSPGATREALPSAPDQSDDSQGAPVGQEDDEIGTSMSHPERLDAALRNHFQINHLGTPEEQQNILKGGLISALTGDPSTVQTMTARRDMAVAQRVYAAQQTAARHYDDLAAVADAGDKGIAFQTLQAVAPYSAKLISKEHPQEAGESDSDYMARLNEVAADTAAHYAAHVHKYTGYELEKRDDGTYVDKATGFPVAGVRGSGLSPEQYGKAIDAANAPVTIKDTEGHEQQIPTWKYAKSQGMPVKSAADYVQQKTQQQQDIAQHRQMVQNQATAQRSQQQISQGIVPSTVRSGAGQPDQPQPGQSGALPGATGQQPPRAPQPAPLPGKFGDNNYVLNSLQDKDYRVNTPAVRVGVSQSPAEAEEQKNVVTARNDLLKQSAEDTKSASQSLMYLKAAQDILDSKGATLGKYGSLVSNLSKLLPFTGNVDASNYVQIAKYLGNAALQGAKQNYGARMTQKEVDLQLHELSPSVDMPESAVRDLVGEMGRNAQYAIAAGSHAKKYLAAGNDPREYEDYLQHYYPRDEFVNAKPATPAPTRPGQQTSGTQQAPAAAIAYLQSNRDPATRAAFKAKYGYLPNGL